MCYHLSLLCNVSKFDFMLSLHPTAIEINVLRYHSRTLNHLKKLHAQFGDSTCEVHYPFCRPDKFLFLVCSFALLLSASQTHNFWPWICAQNPPSKTVVFSSSRDFLTAVYFLVRARKQLAQHFPFFHVGSIIVIFSSQ